MPTRLWETAGAIASMATIHSIIVVLTSGLRQRHLKSSEIFVKGPHNTESLSAAVSTTYKVLIESDGLLSSYSYQNSPHFQHVTIATPRPHTKYAIYTVVLFMAGQVMRLLAQIVSYDELDNRAFRIAATAMIFSITLYIGIIIKGFFKKDDACRATVYFNATETNWVTSSDFAVFASSEWMEVPIKWSGEMLVLVVNGISVSNSVLSIFALMIEVYRIRAMPSMLKIMHSIFMALICCAYVVFLVKIVKMRRRTVPNIEVQIAQAVSGKDVENADILKFDVGSVIRKFANDVAKEFLCSGEKWMADSGVYYDFAITGEHGRLVYGRIRARGV
ncbi:uncharacterized protein V1513DRAFT_438688 [Lipomyces chichibuensis]|uniref:uncharacterized protein n=1 Tax=Lipomyces chichibuensis TaxID=1546026 RepID=UPI003343C353